jgi:hypothetical protein
MTTTRLLEGTADLRAALENHPLYGTLRDSAAIARFMEHHVWAVWDFMSLLKSLQRHLTCVEVPWVPVGSPDVRYLINEIVVGEESDVDRHGNRTSHFEMYLTAMRGMGASTNAIEHFCRLISGGMAVDKALEEANAPAAGAAFVRGTMAVIQRGKPHEIASVFTFGREDVIPTMFLGMLDHVNVAEQKDVEDLRYYLQRHIDVDGGHHGPLAMQMVELCCAGDAEREQEALSAAREALIQRIALWDAIVSS